MKKSELSDNHKALAEQLISIIKEAKGVNKKNNLTSWANHIRLMESTDEIDLDRIKAALDWYELHIGEEYVVIIESGSSLRKKFIRLEAAMQRVAKQEKSKRRAKNKARNTVEYLETVIDDEPQPKTHPQKEVAKPDQDDPVVQYKIQAFDKLTEVVTLNPYACKGLLDLAKERGTITSYKITCDSDVCWVIENTDLNLKAEGRV